jgi:mannosyl-3-phosphoglycerate phosphatase
MAGPRLILFTDLDGTLLDHDTYSWEPARPALERLKELDVPWILVTSKTRAEVELWRRLLGNHHPFIVENGGAAFIPSGNGYDVIEWGKPYAELVAGLEAAARASRCRITAFHNMTVEEVAAATNLPLEQAKLAKQREYDEPFQILDEARAGQLLAAIEARGLRWSRGGRFHHVHGSNDKASAVIALRKRFEPAVTIGLGDNLNDIPLLKAVDIPVVIRSPAADAVKLEVPRALVTENLGPAGWNEAVGKIL